MVSVLVSVHSGPRPSSDRETAGQASPYFPDGPRRTDRRHLLSGGLRRLAWQRERGVHPMTNQATSRASVAASVRQILNDDAPGSLMTPATPTPG